MEENIDSPLGQDDFDKMEKAKKENLKKAKMSLILSLLNVKKEEYGYAIKLMWHAYLVTSEYSGFYFKKCSNEIDKARDMLVSLVEIRRKYFMGDSLTDAERKKMIEKRDSVIKAIDKILDDWILT